MDAFLRILEFIIPFLPVILVVVFGAAFAYVTYYNVKMTLIKRLRYRREFSAPGVFEGEELVITEIIYNNSILPVFFVDVESYIYDSLQLSEHTGGGDRGSMQLIISRFHLMPYMQIKRRHKIKCAHRGYYKMETSCIFTKSIGMEKTAYFNYMSELYVYPKILDLRQTSYPVNFMQGDSLSKRRVMQDPFAVSGIRDYSIGDPFNMINFKATAKSGFQGIQSIKVNKLDYCSDRVFMIYINFQLSDIISIPTDIYEKLMEQAFSFAASFISEALRKGCKIGLAANCCQASGEKIVAFPIVGGLYHIEEILKKMATAQTKCGVSFASLLESGTRADIYDAEIFVITPYVDGSMDDSVAFLKRRNAVTVVKLENEEYNRFLTSSGHLSKTEGGVIGI